ncbi:MAG: hypothetical protein PF549_04360 [Patescibacteria group bacterium]|jgi:hypothetical protein|nr:hypothetical protein [Patescibacteria group bacterium]
MDLKKIHNKLYQKKDNTDKRNLSEDRFNPKEKHSSGSFVKSTGTDYEDTLEKDNRSFFKRNKSLGIILVSIGALTILIIIAFFVMRYMQGAYSEERVFLGVESVSSVDSGGVIDYKITIINDNRAELHDVVLNLMYPSEIEPKNFENWEDNGLNRKKINVGTLASEERKDYEIPFAVFGTRDTQIYLDVSMEYKPENISSSFKKNVQGSSVINASPLQVEIFSTKEVASGELMKIDFIVKNNSQKLFENVEVDINYPKQFNYEGATLAPTEGNNKWVIGSIKPVGQEKVTVSGLLSGQVGSSASFSAMIGRYDSEKRELVRYSEEESISTIISSRMEIAQLAKVGGKEVTNDEAIGSGEVVYYEIKFKNTSNKTLRDLILKQKVLSRVVDESKIRAQGGFYDSEQREVIWKASALPILKVLAPGEEGSAFVEVKIKDKFPADSEEDRNFSLETQAMIESLDIDSSIETNKEIYSEKSIFKINSRFLYDLNLSYESNEIPNSGPFPLTAGEETTFTSNLSIQNTSNDMEDVVFTASFPVEVKWKDNYLPKDSGVQFNERTNELIWKIGRIKAGTGFSLPVENFAFQIGITPSEFHAQKGQLSSLVLMENIKITAKDSFTENLIEEEIRDVKVFDANSRN